ncbi:MAG: FG-GAP-like repeat-containing protein [Cyclobacteriaceae bacterium]
MKVPHHIIGLYHRSVRRYQKLISRLKKEEDNGCFKYRSLLRQLRKLRKKIADLHFQLKIATASGILLLGLGVGTSNAQTNNGPFSLQTRSANPLKAPFFFHGNTYPAIVDLDKDGDYDLVVGEENDYYNYYSYYNDYENRPLHYLLNVGTNLQPLYEEQFGADNPFHDFLIPGDERGPVFADLDKDNDDDLFVGVENGTILYFRNDNGSFVQQTDVWDPVTKNGNPFSAIAFGNSVKLSFADLDNDADLDVIIGGVSNYYTPLPPYYQQRYLHYYENDDAGNFSEANAKLTMSSMPDEYEIAPTMADIDGDGDVDMVVGSYYNVLQFYRQVSPGNFVEEVDPFDAGTQTGNPFHEIEFTNNQPVFVDLDDDNDLDLLLGEGDGDYSYSYAANQIHYFENTGNNVFSERMELANPVGGIDAGFNAAPILIDLDGDSDLDALIGNKYEEFAYYYSYNTPVFYYNDNGVFKQIYPTDDPDDAENPFKNISVRGIFYHDVADVDGDGDLDLIAGELYGYVHFYRNDEGVYTEEIELNPFAGITVGNQSSPRLIDIDNDLDLDLVISDRYNLYFYENTGTAQNPQYEERLDTENPFLLIDTSSNIPFHFSDIDHDGDLDLLTNDYIYDYSIEDYGHRIVYYENTGTASQPNFEIAQIQPFESIAISTEDPYGYGIQPYLADFDKDGDLDIFVGDSFGFTSYVSNDNPAVHASINGTEIIYRVGTDDKVIIDANITLTDEDNDLIVQATVTITNFQAEDELTFTPHASIAGAFNSSDGILTFKGKAALSEYEALLRTVSYQYTGNAGRLKPRKKSVLSKTVEFRIFDTDLTNPQPATRGLQVIINTPPVLENAAKTTQVGTTVTIALNELISDPDDNIDLSTLRIVQQPSSGAFAEIDANQNLIIDYSGVNFTGTDNLIVEVCDDLGDCAQNLVTITVENLSGEIEIYNAVAPNSSGDNKFMRIHYLPTNNKVSIFNRWGDKVYEVENYDSEVPGKRFEGSSDSGKALPSGTYFYKIEVEGGPTFKGPKLLTGYISVNQ